MLTESEKSNWIAALRSGEYKQGPKYLGYGRLGSFCCLGVLCKTLNEPTVSENGKPLCALHGKALDKLGSATGYFSELGIDQDALKLESTEICSLASMNDSGHYSFDQIADVIESHLPTSD